jgi:hypothetical protein
MQLTRSVHYTEEEPPPLGSFDAPEALFQALQTPVENYTILVPPHSDLDFLPQALKQDLLTHRDALRMLLLHVIPKRFPAASLALAASRGECVASTAPCHRTVWIETTLVLVRCDVVSVWYR